MSSKTALLVIDLQNDFTRPWGSVYREPTGEMMPRVCENINKFREKGVQVFIVYTTHPPDEPVVNPELTRMHTDTGKKISLVEGTGGELVDDRIPYNPETDVMWQKYAPSAFFKTNLDEVLRERGVENVLVCGVKTNVCCRATAQDSASHKFRTFIITDMTATNNQELNDFHFAEMTKYFAKAIDSAEVLRRLDAGEL